MTHYLDIADVARRTGLTSRALRFYEARGLIAPLRTDSGRRVFAAADLERIHQLLTLKRAGLTLAQIKRVLDGEAINLARLLRLQIETIDAQARDLAEAREHLETAMSRVDRGEPLDAETLCSLIRNGDSIMENESWKKVVDHYFSPDEQAEFKSKMEEVPASFNQEAYAAKWRALSKEIEAALPLDPASDAAQAYVDRWFALLKPFSDVATPVMWEGTAKMYADMENWPGKVDAGFSKTVWDFISKSTRTRLDAGGTVDGPAWMTGGAV